MGQRHMAQSSILDFDGIRSRLRWYARRRYGALADHYEDLLSDAVSELWEYSVKHDMDQRAAEALGIAILRRRVADTYRRSVRSWQLTGGSEYEAATLSNPDETFNIERTITMRLILQITVTFIAAAGDKERRVVFQSIGEEGPNRALNAADRQRLRRFKAKLRRHLRVQLGTSIDELLR